MLSLIWTSLHLGSLSLQKGNTVSIHVYRHISPYTTLEHFDVAREFPLISVYCILCLPLQQLPAPTKKKPACTSYCYFISHWPQASMCYGLIIANILEKVINQSSIYHSLLPFLVWDIHEWFYPSSHPLSLRNVTLCICCTAGCRFMHVIIRFLIFLKFHYFTILLIKFWYL